jgi:hypothetical protein
MRAIPMPTAVVVVRIEREDARCSEHLAEARGEEVAAVVA